MAAPEERRPAFIVDAMLGRLARWLRILGFDVLFDPSWDDREIARRAVREGRVVLTRDRGLLARRLVTRGLLVRSGSLDEQLRQVVDECQLGLERRLFFSRCAHCNARLEPVERESVRGEVPPYVERTQRAFLRCPGCGQIYWEGSHRALALARLDELLGEA